MQKPLILTWFFYTLCWVLPLFSRGSLTFVTFIIHHSWPSDFNRISQLPRIQRSKILTFGGNFKISKIMVLKAGFFSPLYLHHYNLLFVFFQPIFFDQFRHKSMYKSSGNRHFFTKYLKLLRTPVKPVHKSYVCMYWLYRGP